MNQTHPLRGPCRGCGFEGDGYIRTKGGQDVVRCPQCDRAQYNAPRGETGREVRKLSTRPGISVTTRTRILVRDNRTCVLCHRDDVALDVGHLVSVADGEKSGLTDAQLHGDDNLAAMCASCNSGLSRQTIPLHVAVSIIKARSRAA